jgi:hypothetical protein
VNFAAHGQCNDELEKSKSHILIGQAHRYFKDTHTGRHRSSRIIPEPFFVHSDLTTGIQIGMGGLVTFHRLGSVLADQAGVQF